MIIDWADHTTDEIYLIPNQMLIVKYSYKANDESPLGEPELSVQQKESAAFICYHHDNNLWSKIRRNDGQEGYVPTSYIMVFVFNSNMMSFIGCIKLCYDKIPDILCLALAYCQQMLIISE